jgi:hypothetical protein
MKTLLIKYATFHFCMEFLGLHHFIDDIQNLILFSITKRLFNFHVWFSNLGVNTWVKKIDMIMPKWILLNFGGNFGFYSQEPLKLSSLSTCAIIFVKDKPSSYFKMRLQITSSHLIGLFYIGEAHSYNAFDLMDHPYWNSSTMTLFAWKLKHNHQKL